MAYIGQNADGNFTTSVSKDTFSGNGSTTAFTLSEAATTNTVDVFVENIRQEPTTAYSVDGTTLTFTAAPVTGTNNIYVVNRGPIQLSASHPAAQSLSAFSATITNDLTVDTNTLYVDSTNNNVGIGTSSPNSSSTLHVKDQTDIAMSNNADGQITIEGNGYSGAIALNATGMQIYQNSAARNILFGNDETEQMRIQSGGGISFNGDTAAANALDDYEEGTWTPTVSIGTVSTTTANYTKIGRLVHVTGVLTSFSNRSSSNAILLQGLPFNIGQADRAYPSGQMGVAINSRPDTVYALDSTSIRFYDSASSSGSYDYIQHSDLLQSGSGFYFSFTYIA